MKTIPQDPEKKRSFTIRMIAKSSEYKKGYELLGYFEEFMLVTTMRPFPQEGPERIIKLEVKTESCTIFIQPENRMHIGRVRITANIVYCVYYTKGKMIIICGYKKGSDHGYTAHLIYGPGTHEFSILRQAKLPQKLRDKNAVALYDMKMHRGYVLESHGQM